MNNEKCLARVKRSFFFIGINGKKLYSKGQWVEGYFRVIMGRRMFIADDFYLNPNKFDCLKLQYQ